MWCLLSRGACYHSPMAQEGANGSGSRAAVQYTEGSSSSSRAVNYLLSAGNLKLALRNVLTLLLVYLLHKLPVKYSWRVQLVTVPGIHLHLVPMDVTYYRWL